MFDQLSERLRATFQRLRGRGRLSERDVDEALREVRLALLEADVHFRVVRDFIQRVRERAVGEEVLASLTPGQQVIRIVHEELTRTMGSGEARLAVSPRPPSVYLLAGLQGSGKTTTVAKLGYWLRRQGRRPLLVAADLARPAAVEQLQVLGAQAGVEVFSRPGATDAVEVARQALEQAVRAGHDAVLVDTAGRLEIDEALMVELERMKQALHPTEVLLVLDAMTGQAAVHVAETFHRRLGVDGLILTKLDGDSRGGAALSVREVTGRPIHFAGTGERLEGLEPFHPERMAGRILGMGDVLTLIERAQQAFDAEQARAMEKKLRDASFTLEDFVQQLRQVRRMGPLDQLLALLPGMGALKGLRGVQVDERELARLEAMVLSMTPEERRRPEIIDGSRRRRIARGSGTQVQDVNRLLRDFEQVRKLMKNMAAGLPAGRSGRGAVLPGAPGGAQRRRRKGPRLPF
ncbi:MAG: signal recognition particle protein [Clostridia bacterium]|nr:signal recognition particle protein [Clostridia bacterium]MCL6521634.1 signal recognition particle protein [Bacillota bacterium]